MNAQETNNPSPNDPLHQQLIGALLDGQSIATIRSLLDAGADPNFWFKEKQTCPLLLVAHSHFDRSEKLIGLLMDHGANPNLIIRQADKQTVFMRVIANGLHNAAFCMLDSNGPNQVDLLKEEKRGQITSVAMLKLFTLPSIVRVQDHFEKKVLPGRPDLQRGHLWMHKDHLGKNALMHCKDVKISQWIASQNFEELSVLINDTDNLGRTALWHAVNGNNQDLVNLLLSLGAKVGVVNRAGQTLLDAGPEGRGSRGAQIFDSLRAAHASQQAMASIDDVIRMREAVSP